MLVLVVTYETKPNGARAFVRAVEASGILDVIRAEEGCRQYDHLLPADGADRVVLIEAWESEELQQLHLRQPHMGTIAALKEQYVTGTRVQRLRPAE